MNARDELAQKRSELAAARWERLKADRVAAEVTELEAQAQEANRDRQLNENQEARAQARREALKRVVVFQERIRGLLCELERASVELSRIVGIQQVIANLLRHQAVLQREYSGLPQFWPQVDYMRQTGVDAWHGLAEISGAEAHFLQTIAQRLGPRRGSQIRGLHHALPTALTSPAPLQEPEKLKRPVDRGPLESVIRRFLKRPG